MQRVVEPELMTGEEQSWAYARGDFADPNSRFINLFQKTFGYNLTGNVLDIGCGDANITLRFAKAYPDCSLYGIDGSSSMLKYGHKALNEESTDIQKRVNLIQGIIPDIRLPHQDHDTIISNSLLHHLHNPSALWEFIKNYGTDGTKIFVVDLLRPSSLEKASETVELYSKNEPEILKIDFYNSLLAAFEITEIKEQLKLADLANLLVRKISDRHVLISGFLKK